MRTEVALLRRMVLGIDEDRIIRTGSHACFAADADRFVEIDDAVRPLEHCSSRTRRDTRSMSALIATGDLMRAAHLREGTDVDMFYVCSSD